MLAICSQFVQFETGAFLKIEFCEILHTTMCNRNWKLRLYPTDKKSYLTTHRISNLVINFVSCGSTWVKNIL
jgi:hypothetical protein